MATPECISTACTDDGSGDWGLFNSDGTPRPAATALHNLTTLLTDTGADAATFTPGSLNYTLSGTQSGDNSVLIEKSDGSFWIALWNETETANSPHTITLNLGEEAATVIEYDPLTGTSSIATWTDVSSIQISVPDHPVLVEIVPAVTSIATAPPEPAPTGPVITAPNTENVTAGTTIAVSGVSVADAFAASNPGTMVVNLSAVSGTIGMTDASGAIVAGSGTQSMSVTGTFAQITADLANLSYTAASKTGSDTISVNIWDQAGLDSTASIDVSVTPAPAATIDIATNDASRVITAGDATISATTGNHTTFIGRPGEALSAFGRAETVMAFLGGNTITTVVGNDTITTVVGNDTIPTAGSSNNIMNPGMARNAVDDSGHTVALPQGGHGSDAIDGYVLRNQDLFDLRPSLAGPSGNGSRPTIYNSVNGTTVNGADAAVSVMSGRTTWGVGYNLPTSHASGPATLPTLLAHAFS